MRVHAQEERNPNGLWHVNDAAVGSSAALTGPAVLVIERPETLLPSRGQIGR